MTQIDTTAEIDGVRLKDQGSDPSNPASGYKLLYVKSGGVYLINSSGTVVGPLSSGAVATDAIWDAAGDLVQGTGSNTAAKLTIGTANQLLRVNSGGTAAEWASVGRVLISEQTPTGTGTVTWSSIPATYKNLVIEYTARGTQTAETSSVNITYNNDTTSANYRRTYAYNQGTTTTINSVDTELAVLVTAASSTAGYCGTGIFYILDYAATTFHKCMTGMFAFRSSSAQSCNGRVTQYWEDTSAINRIDIVLASGNWDTGSTFRLYGEF